MISHTNCSCAYDPREYVAKLRVLPYCITLYTIHYSNNLYITGTNIYKHFQGAWPNNTTVCLYLQNTDDLWHEPSLGKCAPCVCNLNIVYGCQHVSQLFHMSVHCFEIHTCILLMFVYARLHTRLINTQMIK